jgi:hypothetical protein
MSSLLVFNRVYRLEIQSVMLLLSTGFVNCCSSNLFAGSSLPPSHPSCVNKYNVYKYTVQYVRGGVWSHRTGGGLRRIKHLPQCPYRDYFFR